MTQLRDDYYYRLGRHQAVVELNERIPKSRPTGITARQMRDWLQGYNEMSAMFHWRRQPIKEKQVI
ncbi:hypothetical protein [Aliikangiella coralliicola]|uniref:Uncharacterized protein n=1 Tax=Aliikangiella coralliicola TaxID=2592383 RepID=A0A545UFD0_9GAMM|nr:hypothetical protein [Aliikangiella coralliicola]TQV88186.1 hypothetical protein FLL46_06565 [Aliikangiella coralliicola]